MATNNKINSNFYQIAIADSNGNITGLNLDINTKLTGGNPGEFLQTLDGLGNLQWAPVTAGALANGTSSVTIPLVNGNVNLTAGGNTSLIVSDTGANVVGNIGITGGVVAFDATVTDLYVNGLSNLGAVSNITITGGTVGQVLSTDGAGVLSWSTPSSFPTSVPQLEWVAAADGLGQVFSDPELAYYNSLTSAINVFLNGVALSNAIGDYTLAGTNLTINTWVSLGSTVMVGAGVRLV